MKQLYLTSPIIGTDESTGFAIILAERTFGIDKHIYTNTSFSV